PGAADVERTARVSTDLDVDLIHAEAEGRIALDDGPSDLVGGAVSRRRTHHTVDAGAVGRPQRAVKRDVVGSAVYSRHSDYLQGLLGRNITAQTQAPWE